MSCYLVLCMLFDRSMFSGQRCNILKESGNLSLEFNLN